MGMMRRFIGAAAVAAVLQVAVFLLLPRIWLSAGRLYYWLLYWCPFVDLIGLFTRPQGRDGDLGPLYMGTTIIGTMVYSVLLGLLVVWMPRLRTRCVRP